MYLWSGHMLRYFAPMNLFTITSSKARYLLSIVSVGAAFLIMTAFAHISVRNPVVLVYLIAIAISFWYGREGPGVLAFSLSSMFLLGNFLFAERDWTHLLLYDGPIICLYFAIARWIQVFATSRHHLECVLRQNGHELERAVQLRTCELTRINIEHKTILDAAPFGIVLMGIGRIVERCNPEYEKMVGYSQDELVGLPAPLPEEQREAWSVQEAALRLGQHVVEHNAIRKRRDDSRFSATIWMTPLQDYLGQYRGLVGYILDNTERNAREAERQMLTALIEHNPDLIAVTDENGILTFINTSGRRMLNFRPEDDLRGISLPERLSPESGLRGRSIWLECQEGHSHLETVYKNHVTNKVIELTCSSFTIPSFQPGVSTLSAFVAQDISERKRAEIRLKESLEENQKLLEENRDLQEKLRHENIALQERNLALQCEIADIQRAKFETIIGESLALRRTLSKVEQVATTDVTILITGETGTGKELIAQAIHKTSKRADMPFRAINCAAFPSTLMASELFGHERGAFTGADRQRLGQFELASGGTLFLDEIGELPMETQAMLLRVLEERNFERLGGTKLIRADVRIIVATNRDLQNAIQEGEFRQDLYFRLNGFRIEVPPLRERKEDIPLLVKHFVFASSERHEKNIEHIEKRAMEMLLAYSWPGNIRELRNVIDTSVIISPGNTLGIDEDLLLGVKGAISTTAGPLKERLELYEKTQIEHALMQTHGRVSGTSGAAALLGMPPSTLSTRLQVLKIDPLKFRMQI